ncbi:MAG TPA: VWA domain-containing protein [Candidatus Acidoferrales bacterium]|nr:VWA domain-containing protein [Candidatus Acidoferrales bacterium]
MPEVVRAQNPPTAGQQPLKVQVELVHLFVTVRDKHGGLVANLEKNDFNVDEDGQQQKIAYFAKEMDLPLTIGLLIDTSGSQENVLGAEQEAAKRFLERILGAKDLAMVINFDLDVGLLADFTSEKSVLDRAIDRTQINAPATPAVVQGPFPQKPNGTHLYDAIYLACHDKLAEEAGRKAIVVLTDAQDYGSSYQLQDAIDAAQRSDTVVHVLLIADRWQYFGAYEGEGVARKLADQTGGRVIRVTSEKKLDQAFDELAQELRSQYVLGYYPTNAARDGSFRKVKVDVVSGDKDRVLTRDGYYAPQS